ncbi:MAG: hypothetical protein ACR2NL_01865 [Acidimicrobiia bacterium]
MSPNLASRLQDLPGVASVVIDLEDADRAGINVRLEEGSDETEVLESVKALLVAYGVRSENAPFLKIGRRRLEVEEPDLGVEVKVTPIKGGARVEVIGKTVRSFRVVPANPASIAQGIADAWCQVLGRAPMDIVSVNLEDGGDLIVTSRGADGISQGQANVDRGWSGAVALAVGRSIGAVQDAAVDNSARLAEAGW